MTRPGEFVLGDTVYVDGSPRVVERLDGTPARPILRVSGCSSRPEAEALRGASLAVPGAARLEPGEFWASDLEGCLVVDGERELGVVSRMVALPSCEALEVGGRLIPMVRDAVRSIDVAGRRIDVDLGFLGE